MVFFHGCRVNLLDKGPSSMRSCGTHILISECITKWWIDPVEGMAMLHIARKLDKIHKEVRGWSISLFGNISKENKSTKKKLESLQNLLA